MFYFFGSQNSVIMKRIHFSFSIILWAEKIGEMENQGSIYRRAVHGLVWLVWLNRFSWQNGKSEFTVPGSTIGSNR